MHKMINEEFRKNLRRKRVQINTTIIVGIALIIVIPLIFMSIGSIKRPQIPLVNTINDSNKNVFYDSLKLQTIDLIIVNSNVFYFSHIKDKEILNKLNKVEIENFLENNSQKSYYIKLFKTAKYDDLVFVIDVMNKYKVKNYAIVDISDVEVAKINKFKE